MKHVINWALCTAAVVVILLLNAYLEADALAGSDRATGRMASKGQP